MDLLVLIKLLLCILFSVKYSQASNQAFIQVNNELRYLAEEASAGIHENLSGDIHGRGSIHRPIPIRFEPASLQFGRHAVGMPRSESVVIFNPSTEHSLSLLSISGNTRHFHCTFFKDKWVAPLGNTSLDVVFLGRKIGPVTSRLLIHTSLGSFQYEVKAEGVPNPYGLKPFVGVQIPLHSVFSPKIVMYNPHRSPLQVIEMYTTGGDLHLELPGGTSEGNGRQWRLSPFTKRTLMQANFVGRAELNHTSFIRIRTNHTASRSPYLVIPVEVEVTSGAGLLSPLQKLDFGVTTPGGRVLSLCIPVYNGGHAAVTLNRIFVMPENRAVRVLFEPRVIARNSFRSVLAARVFFSPDLVTDETQLSGTVVLEYGSGGQTLQLPYSAEVLRGSLLHDPSLLMFTPADRLWRSVSVSNTFSAPLAVRNVTLSARLRHVFQLDWRTAVVLPVNESIRLFSVRLLRPPESENVARANVTLHTNVSDISLPIWFYSQNITVFTIVGSARSIPPTLRDSGGNIAASPVVSEREVELGAMASPVHTNVSLFLVNENPVGVRVLHWSSSGPQSQLQQVALCPDAASHYHTHCQLLEPPADDQPVVLEPGWYLILSLSIRSSKSEGRFRVNCSFETDHNRRVVVLSYRVLDGHIEARSQPTLFRSEGEYLETGLDLRSTFSDQFTVHNVTVVSDRNPSRLSGFSHDFHGQGVELHPFVWTNSGRILWRNPCFATPNSSYSDCNIGSRWSLAEFSEADDDWLLCRRRCLLCFGEQDRIHWDSAALLLSTSPIPSISLALNTVFEWPRLLSRKQQRDGLTFPVTQVRRVTCLNATLYNPSDLWVSVQPMLQNDYPCTHSSGKLLRHILGERRCQGLEADSCCSSPLERSPFAVVAVGDSDPVCSAHLFQKEAAALTLSPRSSGRFLVVFRPSVESSFTASLLIRNNLTVIEALTLQARGAQSRLVVLDRHANSTLMFKLTERPLKQCVSSSLLPSLYTVRRLITLHNSGEVAVDSAWPEIGAHRCFDSGFRVLQCTPISLSANASIKLTLLFAPDFSMSSVQRRLVLRNTDGHVVLSVRLVGNVAPALLAPCSSALPRPSWELLLRYFTLGCALLMVLGAMLAAVLESERIVATACLSAPRRTESCATSPAVLDLSAVVRDMQPESIPTGTHSLRRSATSPVSTSSATAQSRAQPDPSILRRRQAKKEAKSRRATQSWTSTLLTSLGMSSADSSPGFTVIEDVAASQSSARSPPSSQHAVSREQSEDRGSSTTDRSCTEEFGDKNNAVVTDRRVISESPASLYPRSVSGSPASMSSGPPSISESPSEAVIAASLSDRCDLSLELPYKPKSDVRHKQRRPREQAGTGTPAKLSISQFLPAVPVRRVATVRPHVNTLPRSPRVVDTAKDSSFAKIVSGETSCELRSEAQSTKLFPSEVSGARVGKEAPALMGVGRGYPGVIGHTRRANLWPTADVNPGMERSSLGLNSLSQLASSSLFGPWSWSHHTPLDLQPPLQPGSGDAWLGADPATRGSTSDGPESSTPTHWSPLHSEHPRPDWSDIYKTPDE